MSESLPVGWKFEPLGRLAQVVSGGTPSRYVPEFWEGGSIPWVTPTDITGTSGRFLSDSRENITDLGLRSCSAKKLPLGTLLMTSRATLGEVKIALCEVCTNQGFKSLIPFKGVDGHYLYYQIGLNKERYKSFGIGSTFLEVNKRDTERFELLVAPEREQRRIAEILSTVDEAIEQTEALIAKYQQIKAGLMQDLFTRGVTSDGRLRPTRAQAPHLYKDSPLGWIPKEWDCLTIEELLEKTACAMRSGPFGSALLKDELVNEGIPLLGIDNIYQERFVSIFSRFVSPRKFTELMRYSVLPRDVIITIMGTVGRCCVVPDSVTQALSSKHLWTMTFDNNRVLPDLVCWQLNHAQWVKDWFAKYSQGAVMEAIQSSTLRTLRLPVPQIKEQKLILSRYLRSTRRIDVEQEHLDKLKQVKHGLMHDLLTGRVRLKVEEVASRD